MSLRYSSLAEMKKKISKWRGTICGIAFNIKILREKSNRKKFHEGWTVRGGGPVGRVVTSDTIGPSLKTAIGSFCKEHLLTFS